MSGPVRLTKGKTYDVQHARKGSFRARVVDLLGDDAVELEIVSGRAAFQTNDDAEAGDHIVVRTGLLVRAELVS